MRAGKCARPKPRVIAFALTFTITFTQSRHRIHFALHHIFTSHFTSHVAHLLTQMSPPLRSLPHTYTYTHIHTHTHTLSLSLSLSLSFQLPPPSIRWAKEINNKRVQTERERTRKQGEETTRQKELASAAGVVKESDRMRQEMEKVTARADAERTRRKRSEWDRRSGANMYVEAEGGVERGRIVRRVNTMDHEYLTACRPSLPRLHASNADNWCV